MGLFDKVKNLFTEEVEEEVVKKEPKKEIKKEKEIQKEIRKIEIAPARRESKVLVEEKEEEVVSENLSLKKDEKFVFPVYFSDEDFDDLEKPKEVKKEETKEFRPSYNIKNEEPIKEEIKTFRASPIISPVYGILDKNYSKDDITTKETKDITYYKSDRVTVDDIRNKAFGTLEEELENSFFNDPIVLVKEELIIDNNYDSGIDIFEELETKETRESRNNVDLLKEDYNLTLQEEMNIVEELEEVEETTEDLAKELEKQRQKIEEINQIIKNNIINGEQPVSQKFDNIIEELDEIEDELTIVSQEEYIEDEISESTEEYIEDEYNDSEYSNEKNEETNDDLVESDLFNLIDSMYEKRDEE